MTILVTRPEQESQALCDALNQLGHPAISHPLLTIHPGKELSQLPELFSPLSDGDFLIAVSQHAVEHTQDYLQHHQIEWKKGLNYLAVGQKSAQHLRTYISDTVHFPTPSDSEHLLALPVLNRVSGKKVLILRGNGGRDLIYQALEALGAEVNYCEAYQRKMTPFDGKLNAKKWQSQNINTIIITSGEQLSFFTSQFAGTDLDWVLHCRLLVPSERINQLGQQLGYQHIETVGGASNSDLLHYISEHHHDGISNDKK
ncbi:uroporphyrinogen-III synthase [Aliivibrio finisterrensis]|uniref:Uroporphyrinogen-III synthase n=1 Tax=Aliivibrio finisterrensis TaxID=511998 RepID=A0A4Q5KQR0_9GAMM|nr:MULTISPECIES: uroporphyrinogen-III synthase [Aliivibrio]MDD9179031.1 uroporphyrinogen-III synthase [Aliivibrio sp. A6]RYU49172.1 uroporphyrinogen-III synthase [Aliivibrio finisterrensis]RYU53516.1 uroporphyrinogen-III synthase [Aliivibrio finisterrensis]RYU58818.1 uroporphyrinogen-III synthase [Aliivibrio finisterrensis]RYU64515.1 uroporphyrinogen-III synthase [Aliivibrio finisterrensis]